MESLIHDIRYAVRTLLRAPVFAAAAIVTLALGIGATTTIFSLTNALLYRPYPFADEDRLALLTEDEVVSGQLRIPSSYPTYLEWRAQSTAFASLAAYDERTLTLRVGEVVERLPAAVVSANTFATIGVVPELGRPFTELEDRPGAPGVVILSHRLWQDRFGGERDVIGRSVRVDGQPHTIVGVMRAGLAFPRTAQLWVPLGPRAAQGRGEHYLAVLGRLRDGVTVEQANIELRTISQRLAGQYESNRDHIARAEALRTATTREIKPGLMLLLGAVLFVLLIACANVANLLLARAAGRTREIALRGALGASRRRILRQVLTESLVVAVAGGVAGVLVSVWWLDLLLGSIPVEWPYWVEFGLDARVLAFVCALVGGSTVLFGLAPAVQLMRIDQHTALKEGGRASAGQRRTRLRGAFVIAQFAASLVLLIGGLLMIRSFLAMRAVDPGFDTSGIITMRLAVPAAVYDEPAELNALHDALLARLRARPEIERAELVNHFPISGENLTSNFSIDGVGEVESARTHNHAVSPGYFAAMGIPILSGRAFAETDGLHAERVAIINETLARRHFGSHDPIGRGIRFGGGTGGDYYRIVGIAADVNQRDVNQMQSEPSVYRPFAQSPAHEAALVVRVSGSLTAASAAARAEVRLLSPDVPVYDVMTVQEVLRSAVWDARLFTTLLAVFAAAALLLASVGLYGVMAYGVTQRTHELGVRMALGASRGDVVRLVLRQGLTLTAAGVTIGIVLALAATRLLASQLFGVTSTDPVTFTTVPALLAAVAMLATYLPARRALRIDPLTALRAE